MVLMLIAIPMSAVLMGIVMITLAIKSWDGLVADDYYKRGKEINRSIVRDQKAAELGLQATLQFDQQTGTVKAEFNAGPQPQEQALSLHYYYATKDGLDSESMLAMGPDGRFHGVAPALQDGPWILQLETENWRLSRRVRWDSTISSVQLTPLQ